jgi:hypothetical protein
MKAFLTACVAIVAISIGAWYALDAVGFTAAERQSQPQTVRLD